MAMRTPVLHRFRRADEGGALVEFAISLPLILIVSMGIVESMRLFWSYQAAVAGVRDAARYVARMAPADICAPGAPSLAAHLTERGVDAQWITFTRGETRQNPIPGSPPSGAQLLFTGGVTITNVTATATCVPTPTLRQTTVPVVRLSADVNIPMPFTGVFAIVGGSGWGTLTTRIVEDARVLGV
jgi:hypothetical protein